MPDIEEPGITPVNDSHEEEYFWDSKYFSTTEPHTKYKITLRRATGGVIPDNKWNSSRCNVYVYSGGMPQYSFNNATYTCYVKIDGVEQAPQSGPVDSGTSERFYTSPEIWIDHDLDGTKTVKLEARLVIKDENDNIVVDSVYHSFYVTLPRINRRPHIKITFSVGYITEHSVAFNAHADPDETLDNNEDYHHWWYSTDNGETWIDYLYVPTQGRPTPPEVDGTSQSSDVETLPTSPSSSSITPGTNRIGPYTDCFINVMGLSPETEYDIILAVHPLHDDEDPSSYGDDPTDPLWYRATAFSATYHVKTDKTLPLPEDTSHVGVARRITLYEQTETEFVTNGLGSLIEAFSCKVTEEINGMFELEMEYPVDGLHFNEIDFGRIITANPNQYTRPQPFRIYSISKPHNGKVTINAAHISYDLSGITVAPFRAGSAMGAMAEFQYGNGGAADVPHNFNFWTDVSSYVELRTYQPNSIRKLLGNDDGCILDIYGGEYEFDLFMVKLWTRRGTDNGIVIRYGKNLTSLKQDENCNNVYTGVRPYWYKEQSADDPDAGGLVELSDKIIYIDGTFDYNKILLLDLSGDFDEKPTEMELRIRAIQYIYENRIGIPEVSLSVSFVQLSDSLEYGDIALLETVRLGDYVTIEFPKLKVFAKGIECIKTVFNVLSQRYDSIDLGSPKSSLANTISNNSQASKNSVTKTEMQHAINQNTNTSSGDQTYVIMDRQTDPSRLISMDSKTTQHAKDVWKIDLDGISHSSNGVDGPYSVAITQSGAIDSAFLKRGQINGNIIKEETINKGNLSDGCIDTIDDKIRKSSNDMLNDMTFIDNKKQKVNEPIYLNEVVIGHGKLVKTSNGVDFVLFN